MHIQTFLPLQSPLKFYTVMPSADWVKRMVDIGVPTVQLRCKNLFGSSLYREIRESVEYARHSSTQLFINDYWWEACNCGAYGVHLGQEDLVSADLVLMKKADLRLGVSTHSAAELATALAAKPSYVACGAVYPTTTKVMPTAPQGLDNLRLYVQQAGNTPTVAIGGITLDNARDVLATGVDSLAVVRAITEASDAEAVARQFMALWE